MATKIITVGSTTNAPEDVEITVMDRDVTDEAYDASWSRIR